MSASSDRTFVIVGANLAGGAAVTALRERGFDGRITLIGAEPHPPYERPPLSKAYLRGETGFDDAILHPLAWYEEHEVDARFGTRVEGIDPSDRTLRLGDGSLISYDACLIATGARNRPFDVPGRELPGVIQLRTREDADLIRTRAEAGARAVIVGAGFIGCEVAASLRSLGAEVDVLDRGDVTLQRVLGTDAGAAIEAIHVDHGVRIHHRCAVERFLGSATGGVGQVVTTDGERLDCDLAVVGVGVEPVTDIVDGSGIDVANGILADPYLQTSAPNVFAAGDVANHDHPIFRRRIRVEHWDNALKSGTVAARNMLGERVPFDDPHWFWSDQYDADIQYAGHAIEWDDVVVRGSVADRNFLAFYVQEGIVRGVLGMNRGREVRRSMPLIRAAHPVHPLVLARDDADVRDLATAVGARR